MSITQPQWVISELAMVRRAHKHMAQKRDEKGRFLPKGGKKPQGKADLLEQLREVPTLASPKAKRLLEAILEEIRS